jgi:hypothetical protein
MATAADAGRVHPRHGASAVRCFVHLMPDGSWDYSENGRRRLMAIPCSTIALRTTNGHYVVAEGGGGGALNANRTAIRAWERFSVISFGGNIIALQTANGRYVVAEGGGGGALNANRTAIGAWERFQYICL